MKKYYILPLGCYMNRVDAERLASILEKQDYQKTENEKEADLLAVVACSVRQSAVHRVYGRLHHWDKLKKIKPRTTILTGCVLQDDLKKLEKRFDKILSVDELHDYLNVQPKYFSKFQAGVPIMLGCNNFCTYCAVPYTRGRERSRQPEEILTEVRGLIKRGYKEITLLGQNVNSYQYNFAKLLEKIARLRGDFWIRYTSPHPKDFSDELIKVMAKYPKICKQINLPVQSGSDKILKKMNRPYTVKKFIKLVEKIRTAMPNLSLSTDTIVGFPGETKTDFNQTKKLYKDLKFDMAYIAQYSPRPGTAAAKAFKDNISKAEKKQRDKELTKILAKTALEINKKLIGQTRRVLVEKYDKKYWFGREEGLKGVRFKAAKNKNLTGKFVDIKITKVNPWSLQGEILSKSFVYIYEKKQT